MIMHQSLISLQLGDGMDLDLDLPEDGYGALPPAEPFPEMAAQRDSFLKSPSEVPEEEESESAEAAQIPKRRGRRVLPLDTVTELRNSDLAQWNTDYVTNMEEAAHRKAQHKQIAQAKKNAAAWVFGNGLGGVGTGFSIADLRSPLDIFAGDKLYEAITGIQVNLAGRKRGRAAGEGETSESEERRTRPRSEDEEQAGRGEGLDLGNDDALPQFDDNVSCSPHPQAPQADDIRQLNWVEMLLPYSNTFPPRCLGTSRPPSTAHFRALVKVLWLEVEVQLSPAVSELAFLPASAAQAQQVPFRLACQAHLIVAQVGYLSQAQVLSLAEAHTARVVSTSVSIQTRNFSGGGFDPMIPLWKTLSCMGRRRRWLRRWLRSLNGSGRR